jgi:hypothetical protein
MSCGTLFFNFNCLAGDMGFGANIGDSERDINFLGNWWLKFGISFSDSMGTAIASNLRGLWR